MPDCDYCERTFENEAEYVVHLRDDHYDDLGRIDKQRVDAPFETRKTTNRLSTGLTALALIAIIIVAGAAYVFISGGGGRGRGQALGERGMSGTLAQQGTGLTLSFTCPGCGEYCAACPRCPDVLANATAEIPGVYGAKFVANQTSNATAIISFRSDRTSIAEITQTITQTSPFPGCCDDLAVVAQSSDHPREKITA